MGDCGLTGKKLSRTDCDLIFTKTCSTAGCVKKIHYDAFRKVCVELYMKLYLHIGLLIPFFYVDVVVEANSKYTLSDCK